MPTLHFFLVGGGGGGVNVRLYKNKQGMGCVGFFFCPTLLCGQDPPPPPPPKKKKKKKKDDSCYATAISVHSTDDIFVFICADIRRPYMRGSRRFIRGGPT